jgi:hypothetical protein
MWARSCHRGQTVHRRPTARFSSEHEPVVRHPTEQEARRLITLPVRSAARPKMREYPERSTSLPTLDDVSRLAAQLPGSEEKASGGGLAWIVRRKPFAWESVPWPSEPESVRAVVATEACVGVVLPSAEDKLALLETWPDVFLDSGTPWGGSKIIVRLAGVAADHLSELVTEAWRTQAPNYLRKEWNG